MSELAARMAQHCLRRDEREIFADVPPLRWGHILVSADRVPVSPDLPVEEAAILGRLERDEVLSITDQLHLSTLLRWTGMAKAPAIVEIVRDELPTLGKLAVFCMHTAVIDAIVKGVGLPAAIIDGRTASRKRQELIDRFRTAPGPRC